jgi:hypothetical protein
MSQLVCFVWFGSNHMVDELMLKELGSLQKIFWFQFDDNAPG